MDLIDQMGAALEPIDIISHGLLPPCDGARRPSRHVGCHNDIRKHMERLLTRQGIRVLLAWILIPSIDDGTGNFFAVQRII